MLNWFKRKKTGKSSFTSNEDWIKALTPPPVERAIQELRAFLIRGLTASLRKNVDRDLDQFVKDIAQDSVLKILDKLHTFRGESKFTTWAMKIAVREGYTELRKKRYQDISLEDYSRHDPEERDAVEIEHRQAGPDRITHESMLVKKVMQIIEEELTDKQQKVLELLMIEQLPMTVVAEMMDSNRNAVYKLVHDGRMKLKARLETEGINPDEVLKEL